MASVECLDAAAVSEGIVTAVRDCKADWLVIGAKTVPPELEGALARLAGDARTAVVLVSRDTFAPLIQVRESLPPAVGLLLSPPHAEDAVAVRVDTARALRHSSLDVNAPVWDLLLRLAVAGGKIRWGSRVEGVDDAAPSLLPALVPRCPPAAQRWLLERIRQIAADVAPPSAGPDATAFAAGLLQIHDFLDESHARSQSVEHEGRHRCGDYWHAIMHRREPDYGNAKYWFHQVGRHPVFEELAEAARPILKTCPDAVGGGWTSRLITSRGWDPFAFVDLCAACASDEASPLAIAARQVQWAEMLLVVRQTWRDAVGAA
jgi:hypothetical protein